MQNTRGPVPPTFASRDHVVHIIILKRGEAQVRNRPRVAMAGQGHILAG